MSAEIVRSLPVHERVVDDYAALIERGVLLPGDRMPSVRRLAFERHVSLASALQVLRALESRGLVEARPQAGYFVRRRPRRLDEPTAVSVDIAPCTLDVAAGIARVRVAAEAAASPLAAALGGDGPAPSLFPAQRLRRLVAAAVRDGADVLARTPDAGGHFELRHEVARRYRDAGVTLDADDLVVTHGATDAIALALRAVTAPGDVVVVESPAWPGTLRTLQSLGLRAVEIASHPREGPILEALEAAVAAHAVRAAVLTASVGGPHGGNPGDVRRRLLVALLEARGIPIVEDDASGELHFEGPRPRPLKSFERAGQVLLCGSVSKTLGPGLRIGWIAPGRHRARIVALQAASSGSPGEIGAQAVAAYLAHGGYELHLRQMRRTLALQVLQMSDAVGAHFPAGTRMTRPAGGFGLWIELPGAVDTLALHARAVEAGTGFTPGRLFSASGGHAHALRLSCGHTWSPQVEAAIATLGGLATEALGAEAAAGSMEPC